jgi:DnaJ-class molecular chaperone
MKKIKNVKLKFSPGDTVYYVDQKSVPTYYKCPTCLGEGKVYRKNGGTVTCPTCSGEKEITNSGSIEHVVRKDIVDQVRITVNSDGIGFDYDLEENEIFYGSLYSTKEEATENIPHCLCGYERA